MMSNDAGWEAEFGQHVSSIGILGPVLEVMNGLVKHGLLEDYVIGGGIAVLYYTEPVLTYDLDVFCVFPPQTGLLLDPAPVLNWLRKEGYLFGKEDRVNIEGVPVQIIPVSEGLVEEAVKNAVQVDICGVNTRIFSVEYLLAMMIQLNRPKDRAKIALLIQNEEVSINRELLEDILTRYGLLERWERVNNADY